MCQNLENVQKLFPKIAYYFLLLFVRVSEMIQRTTRQFKYALLNFSG